MKALLAAALVAATTPAMADTFSSYSLNGNRYGYGTIGGQSVRSSSYELNGTVYTNIDAGRRSYRCSSYSLNNSVYTNCN